MRNSKFSRLALLVAVCLTAGILGCSRQRRIIEIAPPETPTGSVSPTVQTESLGTSAAIEEGETETAIFPDDSGGKLLAQVLPPSASSAGLSADKRLRHVQFPIAPSLEGTTVKIPSAQPRMAQAKENPRGSKERTGMLPEGTPLAYSRVDPVPPERRDFPAGDRIRVTSPRLDGPLPLPPLATPYQEPVSTDDPTSDYSLAAALAAPFPGRTTPAPFLRLSIPDPFEHRPAARLRTGLEESPVPVTSSPQPPRR